MAHDDGHAMCCLHYAPLSTRYLHRCAGACPRANTWICRILRRSLLCRWLGMLKLRAGARCCRNGPPAYSTCCNLIVRLLTFVSSASRELTADAERTARHLHGECMTLLCAYRPVELSADDGSTIQAAAAHRRRSRKAVMTYTEVALPSSRRVAPPKPLLRARKPAKRTPKQSSAG